MEEAGVTPPALLNKPTLMSTEHEVARAYDVLGARRSIGLTVGPIQLSEIVAFVQLYGEPSIPMDIFIELIGSMDTKYLELQGGNKHSGNRAN